MLSKRSDQWKLGRATSVFIILNCYISKLCTVDWYYVKRKKEKKGFTLQLRWYQTSTNLRNIANSVNDIILFNMSQKCFFFWSFRHNFV